ncbi:MULTISPECIES: ABC transporter permease [Stenotrophomonas]|jgi:lipopolysaccharide transport system permease protein|uniref:ABC transporter permease n=1 Tax=Stenotrophomonas TaxID=40323 RepID=UPI00066CEC17|nr:MULTISPECIES: ABC transporter permease [Stenotrophomonas]EKU9958069.1 ABC transporter permease [Stenotrophomonas maltophilia]EKU9985965.1 ABC transporter permease [Stenotrophomonas maltophilia]ELN2585836.1 ABC transporter permease [Stenotrophomonas maltophilia]ELN2594113.1 ABC transporter permease [Stenotrophomonas maltophilia]MBA0298968.1 ABC transporter permease [Stenotrophomonas maltophilia]
MNAITPAAMLRSLWSNRGIIWLLGKRDVQNKYKGSFGGLLWTLINPLLMLLIYTFVFAVIFKARWHGQVGDSRAQFALVMFVGVIIHGFFAEMVNRAPGMIFENTNYVTKVVFPLEALPVISLGSALFHTLASALVLLVGLLICNGGLHWHALLFPVVLAPLLVMAVGITWILAALGVFIRDLKQTTTFVTTAMLFLSPVFYPQSAWPEKYQKLFLLNPLTFIMEQSRQVLVWGKLPDFVGLAAYLSIALLVAFAGFAVFQKMRKGFADVM